ncbi:MAG: cytidine deaminase [Alphaproteobacteria bacterium]|nr:cytidine deaminase [Alphaproteobacteria bacterium]MBQ8677761.1 cytidine deaminase [Alphaproteobacteria bacterium]
MEIMSNLFLSAQQASQKAYAPYSKFQVGAAIYADNAKIYTGCNVENISFPCGTCAEAGAIAAMIADGGKKILQILIVADSQQLITPCGACLQRIAEFATPETIIHLADFTNIRKSLKISELLPYGFAAEELKK